MQRTHQATKELQAARVAFCQAMLKAQGLQHECQLADEPYKAFVPAGLGGLLLEVAAHKFFATSSSLIIMSMSLYVFSSRHMKAMQLELSHQSPGCMCLSAMLWQVQLRLAHFPCSCDHILQINMRSARCGRRGDGRPASSNGCSARGCYRCNVEAVHASKSSIPDTHS